MRLLLIAVTAVFSLFTLWLIAQVGVAGFYRTLLATTTGWQAFADLVIALTLVLSWMLQDARRSGRRFWPYLLVTLAVGSIGPLCYLLLAKRPST
jgi:Terpene cyclase DEP1